MARIDVPTHFDVRNYRLHCIPEMSRSFRIHASTYLPPPSQLGIYQIDTIKIFCFVFCFERGCLRVATIYVRCIVHELLCLRCMLVETAKNACCNTTYDATVYKYSYILENSCNGPTTCRRSAIREYFKSYDSSPCKT